MNLNAYTCGFLGQLEKRAVFENLWNRVSNYNLSNMIPDLSNIIGSTPKSTALGTLVGLLAGGIPGYMYGGRKGAIAGSILGGGFGGLGGYFSSALLNEVKNDPRFNVQGWKDYETKQQELSREHAERTGRASPHYLTEEEYRKDPYAASRALSRTQQEISSLPYRDVTTPTIIGGKGGTYAHLPYGADPDLVQRMQRRFGPSRVILSTGPAEDPNQEY